MSSAKWQICLCFYYRVRFFCFVLFVLFVFLLAFSFLFCFGVCFWFWFFWLFRFFRWVFWAGDPLFLAIGEFSLFLFCFERVGLFGEDLGEGWRVWEWSFLCFCFWGSIILCFFWRGGLFGGFFGCCVFSFLGSLFCFIEARGLNCCCFFFYLFCFVLFVCLFLFFCFVFFGGLHFGRGVVSVVCLLFFRGSGCFIYAFFIYFCAFFFLNCKCFRLFKD